MVNSSIAQLEERAWLIFKKGDLVAIDVVTMGKIAGNKLIVEISPVITWNLSNAPGLKPG